MINFDFKESLFKYRKYIVIFILVLTFVGLFILSIFKKNDTVSVVENNEIEEVTVKEEENDTLDKIMIDIKGAIKNPGVYIMNNGDRVIDAIKKAGGLLETADNSIINLSKKLTDEMVIIIYTKDEIKKMLEGDTAVKIIEKECICPKLDNDACIDNNENIDDNKNEGNNENEIKFPLSINEATKEELMTLPGIGESKANSIIEYRNENGLFTDIKDIINVSGIGESVFEKIKDYITL